MLVKEIIGNYSMWLENSQGVESEPLISVILPTYSRAKSGLLKKCLDSVLNQSFRRLELIIIDDGSTDGTFDICNKYMKRDSRVRIIRHTENMGLPAISIYEAYLRAKGEYIAFVFDDNEWKLDALAKTYDFMEKNGIKASYGITEVVDPITMQTVQLGLDSHLLQKNLWANNCIGNGSVVLHREVLETVGLYDPHLALTRVCDWDLWLRVIDRYDFVGTNILFTFEHGTLQPDSLGNAFKMDAWFVRERCQHRNLEMLLPERYGDIDIIEGNTWNSRHYFVCMQEMYHQYKKKWWYIDRDEFFTKVAYNENHKYILLSCSAKEASSMSFTRYGGRNYTFYFVKCETFPLYILPYADAVVFVRTMNTEFLIRVCEMIGIPCYYYVDDNFREIAKDNHEAAYVEMAKKTSAKNLKKYQGIITSCQALTDYFFENRLHENVITLRPIYREPIKMAEVQERPFTVGFMGGIFRESILKTCVFPALEELAERMQVRLVCPCLPGEENKLKKLSKRNLEIIPFPRNQNYEYVMNTYANIGIDLLVHCGENARNNAYKTKNALINAVTLGAPLLASDIEPYCMKYADEPEDCYFVVKNRPEDWKQTIMELADNAVLRKELFMKAKQFCKTYYCTENVWKLLDREFLQLPVVTDFNRLRRFEVVCNIAYLRAGGEKGSAFMGQRVYIPEELSYSGEIISPRRYGFCATGTQIREIGLLFAIRGFCAGSVKFKLFRRSEKESVIEWSYDIEHLIEDGYTNMTLSSPIKTKLGELLYLEISFEYTQKDGYVGVYEDRKRRTFCYKVMNKLGHPIPGRDALFIDCRG